MLNQPIQPTLIISYIHLSDLIVTLISKHLKKYTYEINNQVFYVKKST